jgi:hypothetical protein
MVLTTPLAATSKDGWPLTAMAAPQQLLPNLLRRLLTVMSCWPAVFERYPLPPCSRPSWARWHSIWHCTKAAEAPSSCSGLGQVAGPDIWWEERHHLLLSPAAGGCMRKLSDMSQDLQDKCSQAQTIQLYCCCTTVPTGCSAKLPRTGCIWSTTCSCAYQTALESCM